jgi:hypothetical protein
MYHKAGADDRLYIDDDVDGFCPDRELILDLYRQAEEVRADVDTPDAAE